VTRYRLAGTVTITARSTLHDVHARTSDLAGWLDAVLSAGALDVVLDVSAAYLELPTKSVTGENPLLTREIAKRLEPGRHPLVHAEVTEVAAPAGGRYPVRGELVLHGERQAVSGSATMQPVGTGRPGTLRVDGQVTLDIRRFGLRPPRLLGMRVRPEVEVRLGILATPES
jgi:polyisoprenoid-binding protein YceI